MLTVLNKYCHGYVVSPILFSIARRDVIRLLESGSSIEKLEKYVKCNKGQFKIVLRLLESLGWLTYENRQFVLTKNAPNLNNLPIVIYALYEIPIENHLNSGNVSLERLVQYLKVDQYLPELLEYETSDQKLRTFIYSSFILPFFFSMKSIGYNSSTPININGVNEYTKNILSQFFLKSELGENKEDKIYLTREGQILMDGIYKARVTLSYRRLLSGIDNLLFGNSIKVFDSMEKELHLDRSLNVIGSGFQHGVFFKDMVSLLQKLHVEQRLTPTFHVVDTGCGDGSLLKEVYYAMQENVLKLSVSGVIGVDLNREALEVASKTLAEIPSKLMIGDIANPSDFMNGLKKEGVEEVLHIRTFLDHNCPLIIKNDNQAEVSYEENIKDGIFIDNNGEEIAPSIVIKNYKKHFKKWREETGSNGLVTLEVYSLPPFIVNTYLEETENLYFDALHSFSKQYLLSAQNYLIIAASTGLIAQSLGFKKYPKLLPYTRISLQHFLSKPYSIRNPELVDLPRLLEFEKQTMPIELQASPSSVEKRILNYPEGVYLLEHKEKLAGVLYTQRINTESELYKMTYEKLEPHHDSKGRYIQLISLQIHSSFQGNGLSNELLSFGLLHSFVKNNVKRIVGVSRCARYNNNFGDYTDYLNSKNKLGYPLDPILAMHYEEGAEIIGAVPGFRNRDLINQGNGVHIRYQYRHWIRKKEIMLKKSL